MTRKSWFTRLSGFLILAVVLCACTGGQSAAPTPQTQAGVKADPALMTEALVTFKVEVPADSPGGEGVSLMLLDEVTGLGLNPQRYTMRPSGLTHFIASIPIPIGSIIRYRFVRTGMSLAEEQTSDGKPVRYRLFRVDGPSVITDLVSRWADTPPNAATGTVQGVIGDSANGKGVGGILVVCGGAHTLTAKDGSFSFSGLVAGLHNLVAYARDGKYQTAQQGVLVGENMLTEVALSLQRVPTVSIVFNVTVPPGMDETARLRIAGNLQQLGNTFSDLPGGVSVQVSRMPELIRVDNQHYAIALDLPVGADVRYKYTLGDSFWNAERGANQRLRVRQLVVPSQGKMIQDEVITWSDSQKTPMNFEITTPEGSAGITIQFYALGWTQPIPAWGQDGKRWTYTLYNPLNLVGSDFKHRFCRAGECAGEAQ